MDFEPKITTGSTSPIFRQIVDQVRLAVAHGRLTEGNQLPSVRALAERLLINANTVAKAYAELNAAGVIDTQAGRGVFIAKPRQPYSAAERRRRLEPRLDALLTEALHLGFTLDQIAELLRERARRLADSNSSGKSS